MSMLTLFVMLEILAILIISNIILGSIDAIVDDFKKFEWKVFIKGLVNYIAAFAVMFGVYYAGVLAEQVPDLNTVPIKYVISALIGLAIAKMFYEVIKKLATFFGVIKEVSDKLGIVFDTPAPVTETITNDRGTPVIDPTPEEIEQAEKEGA